MMIYQQILSPGFPHNFQHKIPGYFQEFFQLTLEWGVHQISVFQRCYILYSRINITVHYKFAGTLLFDISACEIDN